MMAAVLSAASAPRAPFQCDVQTVLRELREVENLLAGVRQESSVHAMLVSLAHSLQQARSRVEGLIAVDLACLRSAGHRSSSDTMQEALGPLPLLIGLESVGQRQLGCEKLQLYPALA